MSLWETVKKLFKLAYLLHQLLCAMELQNVITRPSKDNELKKKKRPYNQEKSHSPLLPHNKPSFGLSKALLILQ